MVIFKYLILILLGIGSGTVISGAVFAFISIIGIVDWQKKQKQIVILYFMKIQLLLAVYLEPLVLYLIIIFQLE